MLEVSEIYAGYGEIRVLHGVSLNVKKGSIVTLVGGNAAGKSTLLTVLSGLLKPTAGEIRFEGDRIDKMTTYDIVEKGIIQVPEGRHLFPGMTVYENLLIGGVGKQAKATRSETIEEVFELLPILKERRFQDASSLSGGEAQMCAIARGLMARPRILMLDEPSLGLAPKAVVTCLDLIQRLRGKGITTLLVEQNVRASLKIADYAYVLESGRIVLEGIGQKLLENEALRRAYLGI